VHGLRNLERDRHVVERDAWQDVGVVLMRLAGFERLRLFHDPLALGGVEFCLDGCKTRLFRGALALGLPGVRAHGQTHAVRVVEQPAADLVLHEARLRRRGAQALQRRVDGERLHRVAVVHGLRQGVHNQLQAVGVAVAADLAPAKLDLVQHRLHLLGRHALLGHLGEHIQHQLFHRRGVLWLRAFDAGREQQLAGGIVQTAQRRGRTAECGGF
jgi:hypothetical protein